ncbi:MAG: rRNA maturation RNase YbeY [Gemmatimonadota bacterium]
MPAPGTAEVVVSGHTGGFAARSVRQAVAHVLRGERRKAQVAVTFLGKRQMRRLNAEFLGHDSVTDVISFPLPQPGGSMAGDIYICRHAAARNARDSRSGVRDELVRLVIHGMLHVLGWDHPEGSRRMQSPMWRRQERYLATLR